MSSWRSCAFVVFVVSGPLWSYLATQAIRFFTDGCVWTAVMLGLCCLPLVIVSACALDIALLQPSASHTLKTLLIQYVVFRIIGCGVGNLYLRYLPVLGRNCESLQSKTLLDILDANKDSLYGKKYEFSKMKSVSKFINQHPLTGYSHYEKYISMIADEGKTNVLTGENIRYFALSSGSTGKRKRIPVVFFREKIVKYICAYVANIFRHVPFDLRRMAFVRYRSTVQTTKAGYLLGPLSTVGDKRPSILNVCPPVTQNVLTIAEASYVNALFILQEDDISVLILGMSSMALYFFKCIEQNWQKLCVDIALGRVDPDLNIDDETKKEINDLLRPKPDRADNLRTIFESGFNNIAEKIWPNCKVAIVYSTGPSLSHSATLLKKYTGDILHHNFFYGASEGCVFGLCFEGNTYMLLPTSIFFEFLPAESCHEDNAETKLCHQVEVGKEYELVITSYNGLYRYRMGDVVKIKDKLSGQLPVIEFCYRLGHMLTIVGVHINEALFSEALEKTTAKWPGISLINYTTTESLNLQAEMGRSTDVPHLVVFLETSKTLTKDQANLLDTDLSSVLEHYGEKRRSSMIGPMEVIQTKPGTFQRLTDKMLQTFTAQQFKMPSVIRTEEYLNFLIREQVAP